MHSKSERLKCCVQTIFSLLELSTQIKILNFADESTNTLYRELHQLTFLVKSFGCQKSCCSLKHFQIQGFPILSKSRHVFAQHNDLFANLPNKLGRLGNTMSVSCQYVFKIRQLK